MKVFTLVFLFLVFTLSVSAQPVSSQAGPTPQPPQRLSNSITVTTTLDDQPKPVLQVEPQQPQAPPQPQISPTFTTPDAAVLFIGTHPITAGVPYGSEAYQNWRSFASSSSRGYLGGFGRGSGGLYESDLFGPQYSGGPFGALFASIQHLLMQKLFARAKNFVPPATGSATIQLINARAEGNGETPATWQTARFILNAYVAVAQEQVNNGGFDGSQTAQILWSLPFGRNRRGNDGVNIGRQVLSQVHTRKQSRKVQIALFLSIMDGYNKQVIWMGDGRSLGEVDADELSARSIIGLESIKTSYPNSYRLAVNAVDAAWK